MSDNTDCSMEMPRYKSHKTVWALEIKMIGVAEDGSGLITPEDSRYAAIEVSADYMKKHCPKRSGYYVVYEDGYKSFSPADAFRNGNTLVQSEVKLDFMERVKLEQSELREKLDKLSAFIGSPTYINLPNVDRELLDSQSGHMLAYLGTLEHRISLL